MKSDIENRLKKEKNNVSIMAKNLKTTGCCGTR